MSREQVEASLRRANLSLSDDERERLVRIYALVQREMADVRISDARNAEPAVIYSPPAP